MAGRRTACIVLGVAVAGLTAPQTAGAAPTVERAAAGDVQAELSYEKTRDFEYRDVRLKVVRGGATLLDAPVPGPCRGCPANPTAPGGGASSIIVRDLDGDTEPEVIVDQYTGGAHCCTYSQIYRYRSAKNDYARTKRGWRDAGYTLGDPNRDGVPEFRSGDVRFVSRFTAYAFSPLPIQLWRYRNGTFTDVTRDFPRFIRRDARIEKRLYLRHRGRRDDDVRGILAAYLADKYLLGEGRSGWRVLRRALHRGELNGFGSFDPERKGRAYLRDLRRVLKRTGYIR
jgi:hypothetical protein